MAAAVVLPEPCRPASRITVGGLPATASLELPEPISEVSSSWTIFTTCWPGVRLLTTSWPSARAFTRSTNSFTTLKLTSASSSARRISRIAFEIVSSSRRPFLRRSPSEAWSLSPSVSNMVAEVYVAFSAAPNPTKGAEMAQVAKVVTIIGSSPESFAKAADAAVQEAAKTLRGITGAHVISMSAEVEGDRISEYRTTVNIAFALER